jgi:hypothetical protein
LKYAQSANDKTLEVTGLPYVRPRAILSKATTLSCPTNQPDPQSTKEKKLHV